MHAGSKIWGIVMPVNSSLVNYTAFPSSRQAEPVMLMTRTSGTPLDMNSIFGLIQQGADNSSVKQPCFLFKSAQPSICSRSKTSAAL